MKNAAAGSTLSSTAVPSQCFRQSDCQVSLPAVVPAAVPSTALESTQCGNMLCCRISRRQRDLDSLLLQPFCSTAGCFLQAGSIFLEGGSSGLRQKLVLYTRLAPLDSSGRGFCTRQLGFQVPHAGSPKGSGGGIGHGLHLL